MAIDFATTSISLSQTIAWGSAVNVITAAAFLDDTASALYLAGYLVSDTTQKLYRRIDISTPSAPVGAAWTISDPSMLYNYNNAQNSPNRSGNCMTYDVASGYIYMLGAQKSNVDGLHLRLCRINKATGLVEYANKELIYGQTFDTWISPIRGIVVYNGNLYVLGWNSIPAQILVGWSLSTITFTTSLPGINVDSIGGTFYTLPLKTTLGSVANGLTLSSDNKLLVYYDDVNVVEKYSLTGAYLGSTDWSNPANIGTVSSRSGYIWTTSNSSETTSGTLVLNRWIDNSSSLLDQSRCQFLTADRLVQIGENTTLELRFKARDGFGAPLTALTGQPVRFSVVTNRGVLDADDCSLAVTSSGPFRTGNNVPANRQLDVNFDGSGEAACYFQSARIATSQTVEDIVRVVYPIS